MKSSVIYSMILSLMNFKLNPSEKKSTKKDTTNSRLDKRHVTKKFKKSINYLSSQQNDFAILIDSKTHSSVLLSSIIEATKKTLVIQATKLSLILDYPKFEDSLKSFLKKNETHVKFILDTKEDDEIKFFEPFKLYIKEYKLEILHRQTNNNKLFFNELRVVGDYNIFFQLLNNRPYLVEGSFNNQTIAENILQKIYNSSPPVYIRNEDIKCEAI